MTLSGLDLKAVGPRIRMMMPHLTPLDAKVVETVFGRHGFDETIPLKQIAEEAGVSEAMVVKIAKKLGFSGYRDFRTAVYEYSRLPTAEMHQELSVDDSSAEIVQKVFRTSIQALEETLENYLTMHRRYGMLFSVAVFDLDHFKAFNDKHGHVHGDRLLKQVAALLDQQARDTDVVTRSGGEEFIVVLPGTELAGATMFAERMRYTLARNTTLTCSD